MQVLISSCLVRRLALGTAALALAWLGGCAVTPMPYEVGAPVVVSEPIYDDVYVTPGYYPAYPPTYYYGPPAPRVVPGWRGWGYHDGWWDRPGRPGRGWHDGRRPDRGWHDGRRPDRDLHDGKPPGHDHRPGARPPHHGAVPPIARPPSDRPDRRPNVHQGWDSINPPQVRPPAGGRRNVNPGWDNPNPPSVNPPQGKRPGVRRGWDD